MGLRRLLRRIRRTVAPLAPLLAFVPGPVGLVAAAGLAAAGRIREARSSAQEALAPLSEMAGPSVALLRERYSEQAPSFFPLLPIAGAVATGVAGAVGSAIGDRAFRRRLQEEEDEDIVGEDESDDFDDEEDDE